MMVALVFDLNLIGITGMIIIRYCHKQGCHQLNLIAGKVNREMARRNEENHSNHLFLHVELQ